MIITTTALLFYSGFCLDKILFYSGFCLDKILFYSEFSLYRILFYSGFSLDRFIQGSVLFRVQFRQVYSGFWFIQGLHR
jgi:uncharacterized membrane protein YciS (DUF1049 family)